MGDNIKLHVREMGLRFLTGIRWLKIGFSGGILR
jgi:hypothetical protein